MILSKKVNETLATEYYTEKRDRKKSKVDEFLHLVNMLYN